MHNQIFNTVVITGRIGILDVSFIHHLECVKEKTERLLMHIDSSLYDGIIPKTHIKEFVTNLSIVDGILEDKSEIRRIIQQTDTMLMPLPEEELQQYSFERILKKIDIENGKNKPENNKILHSSANQD